MSRIGCWGCLLGVAIASANTFNAHCVAQITPDGTLPNNSIVTPSGNINIITGGTQAGNNLFHSFQQFSIPTGSGAFFNNAVSIQNIISRITGGSISNIDGFIRANGAANVFLLNPNGIIFGPNASLNVGGSFVATTANAIQFGTIGIFSADNPNAPTPLLTINPSALLFNQLPTAIINRSQAAAGTNPAGVEVTGLRVPDGKSLLLGGGNINIEGGALRAYGGRIDLAGLAAPGVVGLNVADNTLSFSVPNEIARADISLTNAAEVNVRGADGGSIAINAQNLSLAGESKLRAGIDTGLGTLQSKAGDIDINATGATTLTDGSFIANVPQATSVGKGGNINITTGSLGLINGSVLNTSNFGQGDGGNINLNVRDALTLAGVDQNGFGSAITSSVQSQAVGKGGNINVAAGSVSLADGAYLSASTFGKGDAGNVSILASDAVSLSFADIYSNVGTGGVGNGGNINITASSLSLKDGAQLQTLLREADTQNNLLGGRGNAGNVNINVRGGVTLAGVKDGFNSAILSSVGTGAEGNGGNIEIQTGSLSLTEGSELNTKVLGQGNAGNITINAREAIALDGVGSNGIFSRIISAVNPEGAGKAGGIQITTGSLRLTNGAYISSDSLGKGDAGNITIDASDRISFDGDSFASSTVGRQAVGKGGDIRVTTGSLSLTNGARLTTNVTGQGDAGNITVDARDTVNLDGVVGDAISGIQSSLLSGIGKGGDIRVTTGSLSVTNGAALSTTTNGRGNAGNITINARDTVTFEGIAKDKLFGSSANTELGSNGVGNGGDIRVNARALFLKNGGQLNANSFGQGNAGKIIIDARDTVAVEGVGSNGRSDSSVQTLGYPGNGGDIQVTTGTLSLTNGGKLSTFAQGNAGNITINARDAINMDGVASNGRSSWITSSLEGTGKGGDIQVTTASLSVTNGAQLNSSTSGRGNGGNITINARDTVKFDGTGSNQNPTGAYSTVEFGGVGNAGDIQVTTGSLSLTNGAQLAASTLDQGNAGNININARDTITFNGTGSNGRFSGVYSTIESGGVGNGGDIQIKSGSLSLANQAQLNSSTFSSGDAGNISVMVDNAISLNNSYIIGSVAPGGVGQAGDIDIQTRTLELTNGAEINSAVLRPFRGLPAARGSGGNIRINASDSLTISGVSSRGFSSGIFTASDRETSGAAGNIIVTTDKFAVRDGAIVSALTSNSDSGGNITINARTFEAINGGQVSTNTRNIGNAGTIRLNVRDSITLSGSDPNFVERVAQVRERLQLPGETDRLEDVIFNEGSTSGIFANTAPGSTGQGGSIFINPARRVTITDGAKISVNSDGSGNAGNITLRAGTLTLDNKASISAQTATSQGGNINLNLGEVLLLRRGSQISATAGTTGAGGDGGNITIDAPSGFIVAVPNENSDITANAFSGQGGNVTIRAAGIFNIAPLSRQELERLRPDDLDPNNLITNDITAISRQNPTLGGQVSLNTPDADQSLGLVELPAVVVDTSNQIDTSCAAFGNGKASLIVTGRGGLPPNPYEALSTDVVWLDTRLSTITSQQQHSEKPAAKPPSKAESVKIVPATGWVFDGKGKVTLISHTSGGNSLGSTPAGCAKQ
ncbi:filamentous hemagglutinin outer membrane protein [Kalymmatonema gypsitolerans NIES-4073]|nr:filamentous hemagglutinin outer membrane protein [Scytonema sp. NIES-4073]